MSRLNLHSNYDLILNDYEFIGMVEEVHVCPPEISNKMGFIFKRKTYEVKEIEKIKKVEEDV
jgi:hypothetical protein